ncbi:PLDc N-terminal domain-containing protein [Nonomuraea sp. NPDC003804]|uniref:PLDc N-terminal domain-containing protein n=1 Tax=Nonomuraea sp. NPDC003804 TaxID=3154547 RepID=UPI0033A3A5D8
MPGVLIGLAVLAFWLYSLFDVITTPDEESRNLPKILWVLIVVLVPLVGSVFWLLLGRPTRSRPFQLPGRSATDRGEAPRGPDDDPDFLRDLDRRLRDDD